MMRKAGDINPRDITYVLLSLLFITLFYFYGFLWIWIALAPLLFVLFKCSAKQATIYALIAGLSSFFSFKWVLEYNILTYILYILVFFIFIFIFCRSTNFLSKKIKNPLLIVLAPPLIWILLMFVYSLLPVGSFGLEWGQTQPMLAPLAGFIGGIGITFLAIALNSCIAYTFYKKDKKVLSLTVLLILLLFVCFVYSSIAVPEKNEGSIRVALIQSNLKQDNGWHYSDELTFNIYKNLTQTVLDSKPELVVWPEGALPYFLLEKEDIFNQVLNFSKINNITLVLGSRIRVDATHRKNTAFIVYPEGEVRTYSSVKPWPFDLKVIPGERLANFLVKDNGFGMLICFEETQPDFVRDYVNEDARFIVAISNNHFFKERGLHMASYASKIRAAENYKYVIRSTVTGITQIINPYGKTVAALEREKSGVIEYEIYPNSRKTFFTKYGNLILNLLVIYLVIAIIFDIKKRKI